MYIVGIAGGSASGKTTFANELYKLSADLGAEIIAADSYYLPQPQLSLEKRALTNYDRPQQFDFDLLRQHLQDLRVGQSVKVPKYDYAIHDRSIDYDMITPKRLLIVEGIFALYPQEIRELYDLKIFVELSDEVRFERRLIRDMRERGRTEESVYEQWAQTVQPGFEQYTLPTKMFADLVAQGQEFDRAVALEVLKRARENR